MFCTNCGKKVNENDQFCSNCGSKVSNANNESIINNEEIDTNNSYKDITINNESTSNNNNQFSKVIIKRLEGSKLFNRTPMKVIYNGGIIAEIVAGDVLELDFPVGQHNVIFDGRGDILDYTINVEKTNSMIYIDIYLISELSHSSGIPKIQSIKTADNIVPVNAKYKFSYNDILNSTSANKNADSNYMGIVSIGCIIVGLFVMGFAMSFCAIGFGFLGLRRSKALKTENGNFLSIIGIIGGIIELVIMLTSRFTF